MQIPPSAPTPPEPQIFINGVRVGVSSPAAILHGFEAQRNELREQLNRLQDRRNNLSEKLQEPLVRGADRAGLEQQITDVDARIAVVNKQIADADANVARATAVPGAVVESPPHINHGPPEEVYVLSGIFVVVVLMPISIGIARRLWRRGSAAVAALPQEVMDRLARLDQAVDAVAVEVERIGEGQRFVTRLMSERTLPEGTERQPVRVTGER